MSQRYQSFREFWPFYLSEHANPLNRRLHFVGTTLNNLTVLGALATGHYAWLLLGPVFGYGFAWIGHFGVEHNRPATFTYPLWSLMGDYRMYGMMLTGKLWGPPDRARTAPAPPSG
jgi:hypothetical protein